MARGDTRRGPMDFYSGKMNEEDLFGKLRPSRKYIEAHESMANADGYVIRDVAIDIIRKYSNQDPINPTQPFAKELRLAVMDELSFETDQEMNRLKFYTAVGTSADVFHGIDGWFEYVDDDGVRVIVTIDVTKNPKKDEWKADVIIPEVADPEEDETKFLEETERYAKEIVKQFEVKMSMIDAKTA